MASSQEAVQAKFIKRKGPAEEVKESHSEGKGNPEWEDK